MKQTDTPAAKIGTVLGNLDIVLAAAVLCVLVILTAMGVVMRYFVGRPFTWLEEVQLACMLWIVFCGAGAAFRSGSHVAIEVIVELFPPRIQRLIGFLIDAVVVAVLAYLFAKSTGFIQMFIKSGRSTSMLKVPYAYIYGIAPVSYVLMIVSYFYAKYVRRPEDEVSAAIADGKNKKKEALS